MDRDITTTAVSKMDTRHLSLQNDTSCRRRCVEGEYSNKQPQRTDTAALVTSSQASSHLARSTSNDRQLLCQQLHALPGQTIGNIDQDINIARKKGKGKNTSKGKGKKGRGKGYNNYYNYNYNHYNTYHNQSQQPQKGKSKGKGPIGSFDNITGKGKQIKGIKNNKGKAKSTSSTSTFHISFVCD